MLKWGYAAGMVVPFWLLLGVAIAGLFYPGYSHLNQAMSELGALQAPTHRLSPLLNNYPLGALFVVFGLALCARFKASPLARLSGLLVVLHGLASVCTGYFSCDVGCGLEQPSSRQQVHNIAGLVMFLSLVIASALWVYLAPRLLYGKRFAWFSLLSTVLALATLPLMAKAVEAGVGFGLYQRINYGVSVIWVGALAWQLFQQTHDQLFFKEEVKTDD
ncbi:DUF998 domain-containing protein [Pseudomonas chlororaphis]|uniref:DUF998 domain-containing protein n=2 Tax=Pseudomonas TaxID=286 RepID=A0AAP9W059_9PSED|nr:DUF998 domain-containing protein [Pseudomonas chlororaphis]QNR50975.1 DUF998 domain-containing protein [Pseudomonas chlororaphis]